MKNTPRLDQALLVIGSAATASEFAAEHPNRLIVCTMAAVAASGLASLLRSLQPRVEPPQSNDVERLKGAGELGA